MQDKLKILKEKFKDIKARLGAAISIIEDAEAVFSRVRLEAEQLSDEKASLAEFVRNEVGVGEAVTANSQEKEKLTSDYILKYLTGKPNGATLKQIQSRFKGYSGNKCKEIAALITDGSELMITFDEQFFSKSLVQRKGESDTILARVKSVLGDAMHITEDGIDVSTRIVKDLGANSLDIVEIVMCLEEEFYISVPDEDAEKIVTVGDIVKYVEPKLSGKYGDGY